MIEWAGNELKGLGASVEYADVGMQTLHDGTQIKLPPVLMAQVSTVKEIFPPFRPFQSFGILFPKSQTVFKILQSPLRHTNSIDFAAW